MILISFHELRKKNFKLKKKQIKLKICVYDLFIFYVTSIRRRLMHNVFC